MRLWTIHPCFLDSSGLNGLWRESLLAQKCLIDGGGSYYNHPQLNRFKAHENPVEVIGCYLFQIWHESRKRSFNYNFDLIHSPITINYFINNYGYMDVSVGQVWWEFQHLQGKIVNRSSYKQCRNNPLDIYYHEFSYVIGEMFNVNLINKKCEQWEKDPTAWR